jgi:hypothetical protein
MMTQFSEEDKPLVHFLKQHHSTPPLPHPDLEDRIMAAVQQSSPQSVRPQFRGFQKQLFSRPLWIGAAIATSMTLAWIGYRSITPTQLTLAEERELEEFLAENWYETMGADTDTDLFVLQTTSSY